MGRKKISTRPFSRPPQTITSDEAFPRLSAGDCGNARPLSTGCADAKQPGETASRLLRIIPGEPEGPICWYNFAVLKSLFPPAEFSDTIPFYLFNIDLHLMQIARSRSCRDFACVAREAHAIGRIAGNLGALRASAAAHLLERACDGDHAATYGLISGLSRACDEASAELNTWLTSNSALHWS